MSRFQRQNARVSHPKRNLRVDRMNPHPAIIVGSINTLFIGTQQRSMRRFTLLYLYRTGNKSSEYSLIIGVCFDIEFSA